MPLRPVEARPETQQAVDPGDGVDAITRQLLDELAQGLEEGGLLGREDQAVLREQLEASVREQMAAGPVAARTPDSNRADWLETIEQLRQHQVLSEDDANALVRQLDTVLAPTHSPDVELAVEFGRRFEEFGADEALAWFKAQVAGAARRDGGDAWAASDAPAALASAIVNSKSRRLRGPPRR